MNFPHHFKDMVLMLPAFHIYKIDYDGATDIPSLNCRAISIAASRFTDRAAVCWSVLHFRATVQSMTCIASVCSMTRYALLAMVAVLPKDDLICLEYHRCPLTVCPPLKYWTILVLVQVICSWSKDLMFCIIPIVRYNLIERCIEEIPSMDEVHPKSA